MVNVKLIIYFLLSLVCLNGYNGFGQDPALKIDELIKAHSNAQKFNGTVLVAKQGRIIFEKGYGFRNVRDSVVNNVNTIFQVGSITKQFTATIILKLAEQKRLSLDDKLAKYFPSFPKGDSITIKNLLTHSSGIYNYTENQEFMKSEAVNPASKSQMLALFENHPLNFQPGSKYSYSNSGYHLLGYIIEAVTGKPYEKAVREMILSPLKMSHSGFDYTHLKDSAKATGYKLLSKSVNVPAGIVDSTVAFSAGALYSTVGDLLKWHTALQGAKVISKASMESSYTPYKSRYGYGWSIDTLFGRKIVEHSGGIFGFNTHILRVPSEDVVVIILNNMNTGGLGDIARSLLAIVYAQPYEIPVEKKEVLIDSSILSSYIGEYELIPGFVLKITLTNNRLKVQPTGQMAYDLYAASETRFFMKIVDAEATFVKGTDGKVEQILWKQNGIVQTGKKVK